MKVMEGTREEWARIVRPGSRVFIGGGASVPRELVRRFLQAAEGMRDVEVVHIHTLGKVPWVDPRFGENLRTNSFFLTPELGDAVLEGRADYTPASMSEVPRFFSSTVMPVDVALISVSPPDAGGRVSLGVSVDVVRAAVAAARVVVAQVNRRVPRTTGDGGLPVERIDHFIEKDEPLATLARAKKDPLRDKIGAYLAELVDDGSTLQVGLGDAPRLAISALRHHRNLGIHSGLLCDELMDLIRCGAVDHSRKHFMTGKAVVSHAMGSKRLYEFVAECRELEFRTSDWVNEPGIIAMNHKMVAVNGARQIDITGQVMRDAAGHRFHGGIGAQLDFLRGAAGSAGGRPVHVLRSTTEDGSQSRIVASPPEGTVVATGRTDVHYVITEHGVASLRGKSIRERALEMIQIADPRFREELMRGAHARGWVPQFVSVAPTSLAPGDGKSGVTYRRLRLGEEGRSFFLRPLHASDIRRLQEFFYSHSEETVRHRYGYLRESMPADSAFKLVGVDQSRDLALGIFEEIGLGREPVLRAVGRFYRDGGEGAEVAFVVHDETRRMGMAGELFGELASVAKKRGIEEFWASVVPTNLPMIRLFDRFGGKAQRGDGEWEYRLSVASVLRRGRRGHKSAQGGKREQVSVGWFWSETCLLHDGGPGEVENPERYRVLGRALEEAAEDCRATRLKGREATRSELLRCHAAHYLDLVHIDVESLADRLRTGDTAVCGESERVAKWASGAALEGVAAVMDGRVKRAFVAVRPPGHHATADRGMGFCIYNHVALMARHAQEVFGVPRVLIVDWDVHHGNGTQDLFFADPDVFYFSTHEDGIFPFTGAEDETGAGKGAGTTLNVPLPMGAGGREVLAAIENRLVPAMEKFRPGLVLISAGFDALSLDPLGGLKLVPEDFAELTRAVVRIAQRWAEGRVVSVLEGGYDPNGLALAAVAHFKALGEG
ncbi:acetoin utilization deacetylase AcuC-like enzyme/acyl-CoA hydrolase/RimJ/RimL family protein N-acetyltransferase [Haloferula luteola]|uniref:Acetoin utilization deacetylase AcuC-like enzyme/acyl-CoA hydrolase/RimJ/RimL family protein N-acetyltransferase n=1 Tax=Haloferula luteola TaxID=595692 RepID=A0A840VHY5_9BACT|nr:GNAT family N-acetyltransferase [Haloferula luteola]MBB5352341.1 acetoin utilization deacetylase AcuC-like enzyme/acyl-CoA hydrolase/RimJ/RimL family protein N-acetyltransferase [Haloferula luteola]